MQGRSKTTSMWRRTTSGKKSLSQMSNLSTQTICTMPMTATAKTRKRTPRELKRMKKDSCFLMPTTMDKRTCSLIFKESSKKKKRKRKLKILEQRMRLRKRAPRQTKKPLLRKKKVELRWLETRSITRKTRQMSLRSRPTSLRSRKKTESAKSKLHSVLHRP